MAKVQSESDHLFKWNVNKKKHFTTSSILTPGDLDSLEESSFHYLSQANVDLLRTKFKVQTSKGKSVLVSPELQLNGSGPTIRKIRQTINKCERNHFAVRTTLGDISDMRKMISEWSNDYTEKYFRDFSGKNNYFYANNFHVDCKNIFVYDGNDLISFGTITEPNADGISSYVIGKALYKRHAGLSEWTDMLVFNEAKKMNAEWINMGRATAGLLTYKSKFPTSKLEVHYDGNIKHK